MIPENSVNYKWIYTYDYAPDSVWDPWRDEVYGDHGNVGDEALQESGYNGPQKVEYRVTDEVRYRAPAWIGKEADAVVGRVKKGRLNFILLADSHFAFNGTWEDTVASMRAVAGRIPLEGIIHLGDLSDGLLPAEKTKAVTDRVLKDMRGVSEKLFVVPGNHDYNYFRGNPDVYYPEVPQFYEDIPKQRLRMIFIDSFDPKEGLRYGFTDYCIHWLDSVFNMMPDDYTAVIFSHLTPLVRLQAWTDNIRNREKLIAVLNKYADRILAFINGHNHCDQIFNDLNNGQFPIISINCAKCEYFTEHKPEGAVVPFRKLGDRTQECFDIMQLDADNREIGFVRFGAGQDRMVKDHKAFFVQDKS